MPGWKCCKQMKQTKTYDASSSSSVRNKNKAQNSSESLGKNYQTHSTECEIEDGAFMIEHRSISHSIRLNGILPAPPRWSTIDSPEAVRCHRALIFKFPALTTTLTTFYGFFFSFSLRLRLPFQSKLKTKTITIRSHDVRSADRDAVKCTNWTAHKDGWKCQSW